MTLDTRLPDPYRRLYQHAAVVTPDDAVDLPIPAEAIYVSSAGRYTANIAGGETGVIIFTGGPSIIRIRVTRVYITGFTVSSAVALW